MCGSVTEEGKRSSGGDGVVGERGVPDVSGQVCGEAGGLVGNGAKPI
jgi:hypothetical protein